MDSILDTNKNYSVKQYIRILFHIISPNRNLEKGKNILHYAVIKYNVKLLKHLLARPDVNVNYKDENNNTILHYVANNNRIHLAEIILSSTRININAVGEKERSALHLACENGFVEILQFLLSTKGIDLFLKDVDGRNPLHIAAKYGKLEAAKALILHQSLKGLRGSYLNEQDKYGYTALHYAAFNNKPDLIDLLVKLGANINGITNELKTPLHKAAEANAAESFQALIRKNDINVNLKNQKNYTALDILIVNDNLLLANLLLGIKGCDVNSVLNLLSNFSPKHNTNSFKSFRFLLRNGIDITSESLNQEIVLKSKKIQKEVLQKIENKEPLSYKNITYHISEILNLLFHFIQNKDVNNIYLTLKAVKDFKRAYDFMNIANNDFIENNLGFKRNLEEFFNSVNVSENLFEVMKKTLFENNQYFKDLLNMEYYRKNLYFCQNQNIYNDISVLCR